MLTDFDRYCFETKGYVIVRNAFTTESAKNASDWVWNRLYLENIHSGNASTWPHKAKLDEIWRRNDGEPWNSILSSPTLNEKIAGILGKDEVDKFGAGWWMITFPGYSEEPWDVDGAWHVDGHWFTRYLFTNEHALTLVMLFSDVLPCGGGTAVAEGSHLVAAQLLSQYGMKGCTSKQLARAVLDEHIPFNIVELTGSAGDVIILHPLLLHARSKNLAPVDKSGVRIMCHPIVPTVNPLELNKRYDDLSLLERSIVNPLLVMLKGVEVPPTQTYQTVESDNIDPGYNPCDLVSQSPGAEISGSSAPEVDATAPGSRSDPNSVSVSQAAAVDAGIRPSPSNQSRSIDGSTHDLQATKNVVQQEGEGEEVTSVARYSTESELLVGVNAAYLLDYTEEEWKRLISRISIEDLLSSQEATVADSNTPANDSTGISGGKKERRSCFSGTWLEHVVDPVACAEFARRKGNKRAYDENEENESYMDSEDKIFRDDDNIRTGDCDDGVPESSCASSVRSPIDKPDRLKKRVRFDAEAVACDDELHGSIDADKDESCSYGGGLMCDEDAAQIADVMGFASFKQSRRFYW